MFSGLVNLLFGASEIDNNKNSTWPTDTDPENSVFTSINPQTLSTEIAEDDDDWLLVNKGVIEEESNSLSSTCSEDYEWNSHQFEGPVVTAKPCHDAIRESFMYDVILSPTANNPPPSSMEESWFITPPPCFTSTGPIYVKTSPYENLLIEHPSMSVYRNMTYVRQISRKSNATPSPPCEENQEGQKDTKIVPVKGYVVPLSRRNRKQKKQEREIHHHSVRNVEINNFIQQVVERHNPEKVHDKREHQTLCRGALKRANKVRDFNGKGKCQRRSDLQHCRFISGANNNRKC